MINNLCIIEQFIIIESPLSISVSILIKYKKYKNFLVNYFKYEP